jgi:hypothetical protein
MVSSTLIFFYLVLFVQISCRSGLDIEWDRERVSITLHPWTGLLSRNLKPQKLILSDFPRKLAPPKITRHTVGDRYCQVLLQWEIFQYSQIINFAGLVDELQINETLDRVPSSCMVHVVKGRQYSAYTYTVPHTGASIAEMESETDSRPR